MQLYIIFLSKHNNTLTLNVKILIETSLFLYKAYLCNVMN